MAKFERLDRPVALVTRIERLLREAIAAGRFEAGRLPTEVELAKRAGRQPGDRALAAENLQREGLLVKVRRKGTFLHPPTLPERIESTGPFFLAYLQAGYPSRHGEEEAVTRLVSALMLQGALEEAAQADYHMLVLHASYTKIGVALRGVQQERRLRGLLFAHCGEEKLLRRAAGLGLPIVLLDHDLPRVRVASVRDDSFEAARLAVRHLAELGHRRIGFVNWRQEDLNPWRLQGYRQGLRDAALPRRRAWELSVEVTPEGAHKAVAQFLALAPRPTALYCFNNSLAGLVVSALAGKELSVPEDVSVMGGGGEEIPGLTCHQADWYAMGRMGVRALLKSLASAGANGAAPQLAPHSFRPGQTAGPPR
ncbi:MAG: substrate-binding domain-containing protein [Gemmataceae bacterium]